MVQRCKDIEIGLAKMGDQVSRMPSWKASALAEFRVTVLGALGLWTVDLKLYLETFEGYTNRVYLGRNNLLSWVERGCRGGKQGRQRKAAVFRPPLTSFWVGGVCLSCVSNAPLHNFCNSWFVNFALGLLAGVVLIAISVAVAIAPYTRVWGFPRVSSIPGVSVFFSCVGALAPPAVKMPCKFVRQHVQ